MDSFDHRKTMLKTTDTHRREQSLKKNSMEGYMNSTGQSGIKKSAS